ncbi:ATP-dependent RNA helicase DDX24 [Bacillus rossius redtenbacheri]|uniref:ATP-dependent RNA helicase DDX24 n=1 Tax=Bacillus rossius redtenbacheri TaxID=93214 RepID=UPI002FDD85B5
MVKINKKSHWKPVQLDTGVISNGFEGLVGIEELAHYELKTDSKKGKLIQTTNVDLAISCVKKKKKRALGSPKKRKRTGSAEERETAVEEPAAKKPKKKRRKVIKKPAGEAEAQRGRGDAGTVAAASPEEDDEHGPPAGMEAWNGLNVPNPVLRALAEQGFTKPTKIQELSLPPAIFGRRDILGAAETGSGKTLAFGIPIIYGILAQKSKGSLGQEADNIDCEKCEAVSRDRVGGRLYALVLTPTRELAIQVKNHLVAAAKYTDIKVAVVVGGLAPQKQERLLSKGPEIVVATPGRLWELMEQGNPHLSQVTDIRFLVIDETDRMVERGHFQELQKLMERLNADAGKMRSRQNFVFSATLTLVHEPPRHVVRRKGGGRPTRVTPGQKLDGLVRSLGITDPKVVDVTSQSGTAQTLSEACIHCAAEEKDQYLYYLLQRHAGRTLVFCNSVGCVRRLAHLTGLLGCRPLPLHASMAQRQRLRNLDRFRAAPGALLLATDVAARGLDVPGVEHVVHYQVPRTSESYVHRSGRTARAQNTGITILLIDPSEIPNYARLCRTLGRDQQLPHFPVDEGYMAAVRERVQLAREVDRLELAARRASTEAGWLQKAAAEMDILLHDDDDPRQRAEEDVQEATARHKRVLALKRKRLESLLARPVFPRDFLRGLPDEPGPPAGLNAVEALGASLSEARGSRRKTSLEGSGLVPRPRKHRLRKKQPRQKGGARD